MSLDKFISGNQAKKKKKGSKNQTKPKDESANPIKSSHNPSLKEETLSSNSSSTTETSSSSLPSSSNFTDENQEESLAINVLDERIFIEEFKDKSQYELFQIILDIIHSSPSYSRNKNLIAKYYLENPNNVDLDFLSEQLSLSINELLVYLAEIKKDFN